MPPNLRGLFEPPLAKFEKLHQQFRFLRQQQAIAFKLKEQWEEAQKKKEHQIKMILDMEAKVKAEEQRWEKRIQCKLEDYKKVKLQYQKLDAQEKRLIKLFEENGFAVDEEE
ncbi:hypothetical protein Bhyg_03386 [Pseudolycoriella hygida]|uniref:Uncharacterized protein n=1 Tax=Pseudolycoriella hygida TaxID=35572 RepID=A0A9Q0S9G4_9DIPT|nr:hypothetical protein Bhyg_03386 [Pseudolycoriella hygida]